MDAKTATEISDYLEENQYKSIGNISEDLHLSIEQTVTIVATFLTRVRAEFIYLLTKTK